MPRDLTRVLIALIAIAPAASRARDAPSATTVVLDLHAFRPAEGPSSGPAVYYRVIDGPGGALLRGAYRPGMQTVTMGIEIPPDAGKRAIRVRWLWRARAVPEHGDECRADRGDSAASVSLVFKRGL